VCKVNGKTSKNGTTREESGMNGKLVFTLKPVFPYRVFPPPGTPANISEFEEYYEMLRCQQIIFNKFKYS
jgi:hypothetical protein